MKHPVLVRVFAVVLSILCLVMTGAGILGLQKAEDDYNRNIADVEKMRADIAEYKQLLAENEGKESYDVAHEALTELKESHEEVSAEHRTELATYTATKGGIKTATEALDQADETMANARYEFENKKKEMMAMVEQLKGLKTLAEGYEGLLAYQSSMYALAALPAIIIPQDPPGNLTGEETDGTENGTDGTENGTDGTENGTGGTENGNGGTENGTGGTENGSGGTENGSGGTENGSGGTENGNGGNENGTDGTANGNNDGTESASSSSTADISDFYSRAIIAGKTAAAYLSGTEQTAMLAAGVNGIVVELENAKAANTMSPAHYNEQVAVLRQIGDNAGDGLTETIAGMKAQLDQFGSALGVELSSKAIGDYISQIETGLAEGEKQLKSAEDMLYDSRAMIWYEMGKLEDKKAELEKGKQDLLEEETEIVEKEQYTDEQKQREKRIRSIYLGFTEKPEIEEAVKADKDFVEAVESYIVNYNNEAQREAKLRGYANVLMIVAILAAIICMLASFEIIKKIPVARSGAFIVLALAAAALGIFLWMGRGVSYSAAGVAFFALMQVLVSGRIKKKKA